MTAKVCAPKARIWCNDRAAAFTREDGCALAVTCRWILLPVLFVCAGVPSRSHAQAAPCTREQAEERIGQFATSPDGTNGRGEPDVVALRARFPRLAKQADRATTLVRQALPVLRGVEARAHRTVDANTLTGHAQIRFGVTTGVFAYRCVPMQGYDPRIAGTIQLGDETALWIELAFNSLSWLAHERRQVSDLQLSDGSAIYYAARSQGVLRGVPVVLPQVDASRAEEAIVLTAGGRSPWLPVTRADFLEARIAALQRRIDGLPATPTLRRPLDTEMAGLVEARTAMTAEEQTMQALVINPYAPASTVFVSAPGKGVALTQVDRALFKAGPQREQISVITMVWRWNTRLAGNVALITQFKERFDVEALAALLGDAPQ